MRLVNPFQWLSEPAQKRAFTIWTALALVVMASLQVLGGPLRTEVAPAGIVSFEFAGEISKAQAIVASWDQQRQAYAGLNLGLDYLFLVAYASAISLGCALVSRQFAKRIPLVAAVGFGLAWGQWLAAILDAVENYALIRLLLGSTGELWPVLALWCAVLKFSLVGAGLVYVILGALTALVRRGRRLERAG